MTKETKRIEAYTIADFVKQIQEAILEGYRLNLEDNASYPVQIGVGFYATLDKVREVFTPIETTVFYDDVGRVIKEVEQESINSTAKGVEPVVQSKPGRKPKV